MIDAIPVTGPNLFFFPKGHHWWYSLWWILSIYTHLYMVILMVIDGNLWNIWWYTNLPYLPHQSRSPATVAGGSSWCLWAAASSTIRGSPSVAAWPMRPLERGENGLTFQQGFFEDRWCPPLVMISDVCWCLLMFYRCFIDVLLMFMDVYWCLLMFIDVDWRW